MLDWYGDMIAAYRGQLTDEDRADLHAWEDANLGGELATSDWPGWQRFLPKRPGSELRIVTNARRRA